MAAIRERVPLMSSTTLEPTSAVAAPAPAPPGAASRRAWLGFTVVLIAAVMDLLDATIAHTAAPRDPREPRRLLHRP